MGTLKHLETGVVTPLAARHIVGRSKACQLQVNDPNVSALHAEITWNGHAWHVRDLASRNGTFVGGSRVAPGQPAPLVRGARIAFGAPEDQYELADSDGPVLMAFGPDATVVTAEGDVLCLPSSEQCDAM